MQNISPPNTPPHPVAARPNQNLLLRFWHSYLRPQTWWMALVFFLMLLEGSALGALSYLLKPLFDVVFKPGGEQALIWVGAGIFGLFGLRAFCTVTSRTLISYISLRISRVMQTDLLSHLLGLDGTFFQTHSPGILIERVQGDTAGVQGIWSAIMSGIGRDFMSLVWLMSVAISIDVYWTLAALIGAPLLILPSIFIQRYIRRKANMLREQAGQRATRLDEIFHGIQSVKLNQLEKYQTGRFDAILLKITNAEVKSAAVRNLMPAMIDLITGLGFFAVLMMAGDKITSGARSTGDFMAFFSAMSLTFQPLRRLGELSGVLQVAGASLERVYQLLDWPAPRVHPQESVQVPSGEIGIEFRDVHFAHADTPVLRGVSFTAKPGKMTAFVGASGAGKSTLFQLLTGLIDPSGGQIMLGGVDAAAMSLRDLRSQFASVSQDAALFDESVRDNVLLGRPEQSERLNTALQMAHISDFIASMPQGLDSPVGPRGSNLSGGQRQRVAIARALIADAPVLLLDEATSALDVASEAAVARALEVAGQGRTILVIAHRLSTVRSADQIIVLDAGRVAEQGNHDELLAQGGVYAGLYALQFSKDKPA